MKEFFKPKPDDSLKECTKLYLVYGALIIIPLLIGLLCLAK